MIGHRTRIREIDDLPLWRGPAVKKKPPNKLTGSHKKAKIFNNNSTSALWITFIGGTLNVTTSVARMFSGHFRKFPIEHEQFRILPVTKVNRQQTRWRAMRRRLVPIWGFSLMLNP